MRRLFTTLALALCCVAAAFTSSPSTAQRPTNTFPVIVVFRDDAPLDGFAAQPDARARSNRAAWG